jgi:hypothetical protein
MKRRFLKSNLLGYLSSTISPIASMRQLGKPTRPLTGRAPSLVLTGVINLRFLIIACAVVGSLSSPCFATTIYVQKTIAAITIGSSDGKPIRRRIVLALTGESPKTPLSASSISCAKQALDSAQGQMLETLKQIDSVFTPTPAELRARVDKILSSPIPIAQGATIEEIRSIAEERALRSHELVKWVAPTEEQDIKDVAEMEAAFINLGIRRAHSAIESKVLTCENPMVVEKTDFHLSVGHFPCDDADLSCKAERPADAASERNFKRLIRWVSAARSAPGASSGENALVVLVTQARPIPNSVYTEEYLEPRTLPLANVDNAPPPANLAEAQKAFERYASKTRAENGAPITIAAAQAAGISLEVAYRFVDVIQDPARALSLLPSVASSGLLEVQDEIARTRIKSCVDFRGAQTLAQVTSCAPYQMSETELRDCLGGANCRPKLAAAGLVNAVLITRPQNANELANQLLPNLSKLQNQEARLADLSTECAKERKPPKGIAACALKRALPGEVEIAESYREAATCMASAPDANKKLACAPKGSIPENTKRAVEVASCFKGAKTKSAVSDCVTASLAVPSTVTALITCQSGATPAAIADCAKKSLGPNVAAYSCYEKAAGDRTKIAMCAAGVVFKNEDIQKLTQCSSTEVAALAYCMKGDKLIASLPPSLQKPAQCVASTGADPMGIAVCMAADGLTPDQRILLQCAASTGGEPDSFAVCIGGQFLMKTILACSHAKFGDGPCFGPSNDLQKFIKLALGKEIVPSSVVGQIINLNIDSVKFTVAAAQQTAKGLEELGKNVDRERRRFEKFSSTAVNDVFRNQVLKPQEWAQKTTADLVSRTLGKDAGKVFDALSPISATPKLLRKLGFRL